MPETTSDLCSPMWGQKTHTRPATKPGTKLNHYCYPITLSITGDVWTLTQLAQRMAIRSLLVTNPKNPSKTQHSFHSEQHHSVSDQQSPEAASQQSTKQRRSQSSSAGRSGCTVALH